jgi:hypothetical protein
MVPGGASCRMQVEDGRRLDLGEEDGSNVFWARVGFPNPMGLAHVFFF